MRVLARVHEQEWPRLVGAVTKLTRDPGLAEEFVSEAHAAALRRWPTDGVPANPAGWLYTVARNRVVDRRRRDQRFAERVPALVAEGDATPSADDELGLLFACCHPSLSLPSQVALPFGWLAACRPARSRACSWSASRPWRSGWFAPSASSPRRTSASPSRMRRSGRSG